MPWGPNVRTTCHAVAWIDDNTGRPNSARRVSMMAKVGSCEQAMNYMLTSAVQRQSNLFSIDDASLPLVDEAKPFRIQLLKWIGNKQKQADDIIRFFPEQYGTYFEPFIGSGGVLGVLAPKNAIASDAFAPLIEIGQALRVDKEGLTRSYAQRYALIAEVGKKLAYARVLANYNADPNGADLLFLCRACYGGVVRFRKSDGHMSTPVGVHDPV